jgi:hypothetical protein
MRSGVSLYRHVDVRLTDPLSGALPFTATSQPAVATASMYDSALTAACSTAEFPARSPYSRFTALELRDV